MTSTSRSIKQPVRPEQEDLLAWRSWPLVDARRWSWLVLVVLASVVGGVWYLGGGWMLAGVAAAALGVTLWAFWLPVDYEVASLGLRRRVLNRTRLVPWHAIRAYQLRSTGIVIYQRSDPGIVDMLRSMFIPFPPEADELLVAMRQYASHAVELSP
jgi:hypothetical protein